MKPHTPGPWFPYAATPEDMTITAAPDLLDEAKKQVVWLRHIRDRLGGIAPGSIITGIDQSLKGFDAAIAKAEGRNDHAHPRESVQPRRLALPALAKAS